MLWIIIASILIIVCAVAAGSPLTGEGEGTGLLLVSCSFLLLLVSYTSKVATDAEDVFKDAVGSTYYKVITEAEYKTMVIEKLKIELEDNDGSSNGR